MIPQITPKLAGWIAALAAAALAIAAVVLTTDLGAGILVSYRACADFEREQMLEQRRHTPED